MKKKWFPAIDYRVYLCFGIFLLIGAILLIYQSSIHIDCDKASFVVRSDDYSINRVVEYIDNTKGARSWEWDFGDGSPVDHRQRTFHRYTKTGEYIVKLKINGTCIHEKLITINSISSEQGYLPIIYGADVAFVGDNINFIGEKSGGESWEWSFGETGSTDALTQSATYRFQTPGDKRVTLIVNGDFEHAATKTVYVAPKELPKNRTYLSAYNITNIPDLPMGEKEEDPLNLLLQHLPVNPVSKMVEKDSLVSDEKVAAISTIQLKRLLSQVAEQSKSKEDFKDYLCGNYDVPVVINDTEIVSFERFCEIIDGKKIKIIALKVNKNSQNCIQDIYIQYLVKRFFIWLPPFKTPEAE